MTKRYRITKKHSVYGNDLKILSSAIKYREKELLDYPIEAMGKEISIDTFPPHLKNTSRLLLSNYVDYFKQIYFIVAFINEHYKNKNCLIQNSGNWKVNVNDIHGYSSTQYALNEKEVFLKKVIELCNDAFDIKHELSGFDLHPAIVSLCSFFEARIKRRVYFNAMDTLSEKQIMVLLGMLKAVFHNAEYKRRVKNRKAAIAKGINSISSMLEHYKVGDEITISRFCLGFYQVYNAEKEARSPQGEDLSEDYTKQKNKQLELLINSKNKLFSAKRKKDMFENVADYIWKIDKSIYRGYYLHVVMIVKGNKEQARKVKKAFAAEWKNIVGKRMGLLFHTYGVERYFYTSRLENGREDRSVELKAYIDDIIKLFYQDVLARVACGKRGFGRSLDK
ncbi:MULTISPECIES: hypothetical protein [Aeromonas]|uniref:hypothetical protein n=1 Tax=Aeromonas TaxID=642 RepID=UPI00244C77F9|nr:hypothetical protein [Aeromonas caviae]MDH0240920.1 hypothetical protein [Aeromonas caviae]